MPVLQRLATHCRPPDRRKWPAAQRLQHVRNTLGEARQPRKPKTQGLKPERLNPEKQKPRNPTYYAHDATQILPAAAGKKPKQHVSCHDRSEAERPQGKGGPPFEPLVRPWSIHRLSGPEDDVYSHADQCNRRLSLRQSNTQCPETQKPRIQSLEAQHTEHACRLENATTRGVSLGALTVYTSPRIL